MIVLYTLGEVIQYRANLDDNWQDFTVRMSKENEDYTWTLKGDVMFNGYPMTECGPYILPRDAWMFRRKPS